MFGVLTGMKRKSLAEKLRNNQATNLTQEELQQAFQLGEFDPAYAYSTFAKIIFTTLFFQPILPLGTALAVIGLVLTYYAFKKKLLRDSRSPVMVSDDIAEVTLYLLNCVPFAYGVDLLLIQAIECYLPKNVR